jgi:hypothetical protein
MFSFSFDNIEIKNNIEELDNNEDEILFEDKFEDFVTDVNIEEKVKDNAITEIKNIGSQFLIEDIRQKALDVMKSVCLSVI